MPEGDTVARTARRLDAALAGQVLRRTDFRVPGLATVNLSGCTVRNVTARGKHLLTRIDDLTLHTSLRMDGSWHLYRAHRRPTGGPLSQLRVLLVTDRWHALGYRLPVVELVRTSEEERLLGHLGPGLLGADWNEPEAIRRLAAAPATEIGPALLDQRNLAGIGNLYKSETLFLAGVPPTAPVSSVPDLGRVVRLARRLLVAGRDTGRQVTTGDPRPGHEHWVYGRAGLPCRRCGTSILRLRHGPTPHERDSYWCPRCQPGGAPR